MAVLLIEQHRELNFRRNQEPPQERRAPMTLSYFRPRLSTGFRLFAAIVLLCGAGAALSSAQVLRSSITGRVSDASGAAVAVASITVFNQQTGVVVHTTTDTSGNYTVPELDPGLYSVTVEKTGFTQQTAKDIQLMAEQTLRSDMKLTVGSVTESVQVTGQSGLINTENGTISTAITTTQFQRSADCAAGHRQLFDSRCRSRARIVQLLASDCRQQPLGRRQLHAQWCQRERFRQRRRFVLIQPRRNQSARPEFVAGSRSRRHRHGCSLQPHRQRADGDEGRRE